MTRRPLREYCASASAPKNRLPRTKSSPPWAATLKPTSTSHRKKRSEEHTSELQSHSDLHSFPTRRSSDLAIFDPPSNRERLKALETRIADPHFWNDQEAAQGVLRERKRAEEQIAADEKLTAVGGDLETYIHLAQEEKIGRAHV